MAFNFVRRRVYIEISDSSFFIGTLKKKKGVFFCAASQKKELLNGGVYDGGIHNPSFFFTEIREFLLEQGITNAKAIVCCPYLFCYGGLKKKLAFFQISLCISKAGLAIEKLFDYRLLRKKKV